MKVFVTGATGAIGTYVVPLLVQAGHDVTALARSPEKAARLEAAGVRPVADVSLFDAVALKDAFADVEVVANLATAIPTVSKAVRASAWADHNRIRTEGSRAVVDAALAARVDRVIQESITFIYADAGDAWIDETSAVDCPPPFASTLDAEASAARFAQERDAVVLRFAGFYGPHSHHTDVFMRAARRHIAPIVGRGRDHVSSIHLRDAASAVVAALHAPPGTYDVGDDEPVTKKELGHALGAAVGKRPWFASPGRLGVLAGKSSALLRRSQRISNRKLRSATGWAPTYPSVREGYAATVKEMTDA
ncbi:MAG: hypothetical protein QOE63_1475 [Acidimicrobiaceae bacterium]